MIVSIIPARGGSIGIPRKNMHITAGIPLLGWTINQAIKEKKIDKVYVTTDDNEIAQYAKSLGAEVVIRPEGISGSEASSESAIKHALKIISKESAAKVDLIVFLQATSPLRMPKDLKDSIDFYYESNADSIFSSSVAEDLTLWQKNKKDNLNSINYDFKNRTIRQEAPTQYIENGSIYIFTPEILKDYNNRLGGKIETFVMKSWQAHEIDTIEDIELVEYYISKYMDST